MKPIDSFLLAFGIVGMGHVFFSSIPFLYNIVFWPQYVAERYGLNPWHTWPSVLQLLVPVLGWVFILQLLAALVKRGTEART